MKVKINLIIRLIAVSTVHFVFLSYAAGQIQFEFGSEYSYLKGSEASGLQGNWIETDYDDSAWGTGTSPFRYGDGTGGTLLSDMRNNYSTIYLRSIFSATNIGNIKEIGFRINYDDGFILWINGKEIISKNAPSEPTFNALSPSDHESGTPEYILIDSSDIDLVEGENTLAMQVFNVLLNSSDFYFDASISAQLSLPEVHDSLTMDFDYPAGFYNNPFELTLTSPSADLNIVYTLDGSNPQYSGTSITESGPVTILIDPIESSNRPQTPAFIVRASLVKPGFAPSKPVTQTYIFIEEIKIQGHPGGEWPSSDINGQLIDLDIDQQIINDGRYTDLFDDAIFQIPTISLVTDLNNLFNPQTGIYVNAREHGSSWERDCSVEYIYADGSEGFQINAGLRIRGGNSRNDHNPKHAFRLFFREKYGASKLEFPLFGEEGADEFDKLDLRTAQNYSWSMDGSEHNTFVRDIFSRDSQLDMGNQGTRGDYLHLFLNGMYWGLFQTEERPEARFAASYFGDDKEDYDVIKVAVEQWPYYNEATDGNMDAWEELWNLCEKGFSSNADYFQLEGKDAYGKPVKNSMVLVDIDNLIDFMLVIFYTANVDAPVSAWHSNNMPNNYYAIYNRKDKGKGFIFLTHDSEHCMFIDPIYVNDGLYENRVTINDPPMAATGIYDFQPQWLHEKLTENIEYRIRFADRAYKHLSDGGVLSKDSCERRFKERADEIDLAVIAESSRWGDSKVYPPRNKYDDWLPEINSVLNDFIPYRTDIVINQLRAADLYTSLLPPVIKESETILDQDFEIITENTVISIENENNLGTVYYTINGNDPRSIGGSISSGAYSGASPVQLEVTGSTIISARIKDGDNWSALKKITLALSDEDYNSLKVTELHYHPEDVIDEVDTTEGKDYEFIELKNTGTNAINISGLKIDSAISYVVPGNTIVPPGQFYVIASKPEKFYDYYGIYPSGNFAKNLSNAGEHIIISDPDGEKLISFTYSDELPWPIEADGDGFSLVSVELSPQGDPNSYQYWRKSLYTGGSPFADDLVLSISEPMVEMHFAKPEIEVFPNPACDYLIVKAQEVAQDAILHVKIINLNGATILEQRRRNNTEISLTGSNMAPGVYMIQIQYDKELFIKKLIINAQ